MSSWTNVKGWETEAEQGLLAALSQAIPSPEGLAVVVEIGSEFGMSASIFAQYASAYIHCVEINPQAPFMQNIKNAGYHTDDIIPVFGNSLLIPIPPKVASYGIDLLFVDGDHSFEGAYADLDRWSKYMKSYGIIAVHDCACSTNKNSHLSHYAVMAAVQKWLSEQEDWRIAFTVDSTVVIIRR